MKNPHQSINEGLKKVYEADRGFGIHSFGSEPSVDSYVSGLNAAEKRNQEEADRIVTNLAPRGRFVDGNGVAGFEGVKSSTTRDGTVYLSMDGIPEAARIYKSGDRFKAAVIYSRNGRLPNNPADNVDPGFSSQDDAFAYAVYKILKFAK